MKTIYIDADACTVKAETYKVALRYGWAVRVVANQTINTPRHPLIIGITVGSGDDVADDWIVEQSGVGDVVITSDIPLAARCLKKGTRVLGQKGKEFTDDSIGSALAGRELSQNLREMVCIDHDRVLDGKNPRVEVCCQETLSWVTVSSSMRSPTIR